MTTSKAQQAAEEYAGKRYCKFVGTYVSESWQVTVDNFLAGAEWQKAQDAKNNFDKTPTSCVLYFDQKFVKAIIDLHFFFDDIQKVLAWLTIDNQNLGGIAPILLINIGKGERVYQFIDSAIERSDQNEEVNFG